MWRLVGVLRKPKEPNEIAELARQTIYSPVCCCVPAIVLHQFDPAKAELVLWQSSYVPIKGKGLLNSPMKPGVGIAGRAFELKQSVRIADVQQHPWFVESEQADRFSSLMVIPLLEPEIDVVFGTLSLHSGNASQFSLEDERLAVSLCTQAAIALGKLHQFAETTGHANRLQRILEWLPSLDQGEQEFDPDIFYEEVVRFASEILGFGAVILHLVDTRTAEFVLSTAVGIPEETLEKSKGKRSSLRLWEPFVKEEFKVGHLTYLVPDDAPEQQDIPQENFYIFSEGNTEGWNTETVLFTLLEANGKCFGRLAFDLPKNGRIPSPELFNTIDVFGSMVVWALERNLASKRRRDVMMSISEDLAKSESWQRVGDLVVEAGAKLIDAEGCSLYLVHDDKIELTHSNYQTSNIGKTKPLVKEAKCGLAAWAALTNEIICSNNEDYREHLAWSGDLDHLKFLDSQHCYHLLIVPIISEENLPIGVLIFENKIGFSNGFDEADINLVQYMARHIAIAKAKVDRLGVSEMWKLWGLEDDLHELLNWQQMGVVTRLQAAINLLKRDRCADAQIILLDVLKNAQSTANEIKSVHSMTTSQYLEIKDMHLALEAIRDVWLLRIDKAWSIVTDLDPVPHLTWKHQPLSELSY